MEGKLTNTQTFHEDVQLISIQRFMGKHFTYGSCGVVHWGEVVQVL
jgi:hypothetical protein